MPLYDFRCPECGVTLEDVYLTTLDNFIPPVCRVCDTAMERVFPKPGSPDIKDGTEKFH